MTSKRVKPAVRTIEIQPGQFFFRVRPMPFRAWPAAGESGEFEIVNGTGLRAEVDFQRDDLVQDAATGRSVRTLTLRPNKTSRVLRVNPRLGKGVHEYSVTLSVARGGLEAMGGSRPEIEIQR